MELSAATLAQVRRGKDGRMVIVDDDVSNVVRDLQAIDPSLRVRFSEAAGYFAVYQDLGDREHLVTTAQELDPRIVERVSELASKAYDYVAEVEQQDNAAERAKDHRLHEQVGEIGERLAHAMRKDLGMTTHRAFIEEAP